MTGKKFKVLQINLTIVDRAKPLVIYGVWCEGTVIVK